MKNSIALAVIASLVTTITGASSVFAEGGPKVEIVSLTCTFDVGFESVRGEIKNLTDKPISGVGFDAKFKTESGVVVSVSPYIVATYNPILPGQISSFHGDPKGNPAIATVEVTPNNSDGTLSFIGKNKAECRPSH
ncbi:hypothetical protein [Magnetospirillum sp. 15-1]|uniref:hypothetical protein n=1 Tax=Magnetospirillum sp. 15-1 TaxID=1979370 RepID=UPI001141905E|nr:hypothetical protein [Magnetospirillum sp. 15-1]